MSVSIKDVAAAAGVSKTTVSATMNNMSCVRPETRERVLEAARLLGYRPNTAARELITRQKNNIGIVNLVYDVQVENNKGFFNSMVESTYYDIASVIMSEVSKTRYGLLIERAELCENDRDLPSFVKNDSVAGVFLIGSVFSDAYIERLTRYIGNAVVVVGNHSELVDCVRNDYVQSAYSAVQYLTQRGHRRIAFINGDPLSAASPDKFQGYRMALDDAGIPFEPALVDQAPFTGRGGYEAFRRMWSRNAEKPTGVFFSTDELAVGAARFMYEQGISVPGDLSVVGFEDSVLAEFMTPPLTTIRRNKHRLGYEACRQLFSRIESPERDRTLTIVPFSIVERDSVRTL